MKIYKILLPLVILLSAVSVFGQKEKKAETIEGIRSEIIVQIDAAEEKYVALAEITPQEKYAWRPAEDVRSIGEVFMHVAFGNYLISGVAGAKKPSGLPEDFEKITDKKQVIEHLKKSFDHARQTVRNTKESDLAKEVSFFGRKTTNRGVLYFLTIHVNQHLGQSIAYSRMNGIVPPWSAG